MVLAMHGLVNVRANKERDTPKKHLHSDPVWKPTWINLYMLQANFPSSLSNTYLEIQTHQPLLRF